MSSTLRIAALMGTLALGACAVGPPPGPSVAAMPGKGKNLEAFQQDDAACRTYAAQTLGGVSPTDAANQSMANSAVVGTLVGAAAGAAIGAAAGNPAMGAAIGAGSGLFLGGVNGAGAASYSAAELQQRYDMSYVQCMYAKGESVPTQVSGGYGGYGGYPGYPAYAPAYGYGYPYGYPYPYWSPGWYGPGFVSFGFGFHSGWHGGGWHHH